MTENQLIERKRTFDENYARIQEEMAKAAADSERAPEDITLLAATKTVPAPMINYGIGQGLSCIGENRVQELGEKYPDLELAHCDLQFIGRLQTNKVKYLLGKVSCIQSVDSVKLAREISRLCRRDGLSMNVLLEVNIGREQSKGGILPEALLETLDEIRALPGLRVKGLMAIPPAQAEERELAGFFSAMEKYYVDIKGKKLDNVSMDILSMGMSSDFALAIRCGANLVRVGSALFGARGKK